MTKYNVVRSSQDDGGGGEFLPAILEAVLDGEVSATDSRVVETLRTDAEAARRFKEVQRVTDRLARRVATPDLSGSILAVVHAKQPFATARRRHRVSPQRLAFAGGLIAGIALVVVLQTVARQPRVDNARARSSEVATVEGSAAPRASDALPDAQPSRSAPEALRPRTALAFHDPAKYEAATTSSHTSGGVRVASMAGDMTVSSPQAMSALVPAQAIDSFDPCIEPSLGLASIESRVPLTPLTVASEPHQEWPPADINAFIEHIERCGVSEELTASIRAN